MKLESYVYYDMLCELRDNHGLYVRSTPISDSEIAINPRPTIAWQGVLEVVYDSINGRIYARYEDYEELPEDYIGELLALASEVQSTLNRYNTLVY